MACDRCPCGSPKFKKHGRFGPERRQRYRCHTCGRTFSEPSKRLFAPLRVPERLALQVVRLLAEGVGVRAAGRIVGIHRDTVLRILRVAGLRCAALLDRRLTHLNVESLEVDELWARVGCSQKKAHPSDQTRGDFYTFIGMDSRTKLVVSHLTSKRNDHETDRFVRDLSARVPGRVQVTVDGWRSYQSKFRQHMLGRLDLAVAVKEFHQDYEDTTRRYSPPPFARVNITVRAGAPNPRRISTSHVERLNLSIRTHNRRFTRLCLGFSRDLDCHRYSVALTVATHNFCKVHTTLGCTPAVGARLTDHTWTVEELLREARN